MTDESHLDSRYFIDEHVYNCPYCNRRNVAYSLQFPKSFDWSSEKKCYIQFARCHSCNNVSMHLTFDELAVVQLGSSIYRFKDGTDLDDKFFYSVPTSFFVLDKRIPKILRDLMTEAEGCLKGNFLTGASACARKMVYELARIEKAEGEDYEDRLKSLKAKRTDVEGEYFDTLLTIQQLTSEKVHEESYDGWSAKHLRLILSTIKEILGIMYVIPEVRKEKRQSILAMKDEIVGAKKDQAKGAS